MEPKEVPASGYLQHTDTEDANNVPGLFEEDTNNPIVKEQSTKSKKSKKGKKKKKLSKKERERLKREEQERVERERAEQEKQKRLELEREEAQRQIEEVRARVQFESEQLDNLRKERDEIAKSVLEKKKEEEDLNNYLECSHTCDVRKETEDNRYIADLRASDATSLTKVFEEIKTANEIASKLELLYSSNTITLEDAKCAVYKELLDEIRSVIDEKLRVLMEHHLIYSDKLATSKNEVMLIAESDPYFYGLWVNLSKNPRIKKIDFNHASIEIPKEVAMTSLAISIIQKPHKLEPEDYILIGNLIECSFLQLPVAPKKISGMVLRHLSSNSVLQKLDYPLKNKSPDQAPLVFTIKVQKHVFSDYTEDMTVFYIKEDQSLDSSPISNIKLDKERSTVTFSSSKVGCFALSVKRNKFFPLSNWSVGPISDTEVELTFENEKTSLSLLVDSEGYVSMKQPFQFEHLTPLAAFRFLEQRGICLKSYPLPRKFEEKTAEFNEMINLQVSECCLGVKLGLSTWNQVLAKDCGSLLYSIDGHPDFGPGKERPIQILSGTYREVINCENMDQMDVREVPGTTYHNRLMPAIFERTPESIHQKIKSVSAFMVRSVNFFMNKANPFTNSYSKS